ncbi:MAG TPA: NAD(P)/FAD-dependent oxidoreductase [Bacillota bacterium]|nr:NAD(P)/FAD-dependent oxidoreductase [Bacillota bacterium]HPZ85062.1 NAD(P)/FAD-dependent oxidoreductase [Bacillota bacterium]
MIRTELAIVGAGPAGVCAALEAASYGVKVTLIDREQWIGGQLVKQTHKFFGWYEKSAGTRGVVIAKDLAVKVKANPDIRFMGSTEVLGYYQADGVLLLETPQGIQTLKPERLLVATGASEKMILFPGNDLPGVYGAGAVQTLMNVHGVRPGKSVLMIGSGNIGLIVSYQMAQAGVKVAAVVEALPHIGGYAVHASKIRRLGIPIYTRHTIKEAYGTDCVEGAVIWQLDDDWQGIPGTEKQLDVDVICLATGLTPLCEFLWQAGAEMTDIPELGGFVPLYDEHMETTAKGIYVAGDAAGIEEASTAMAEGRLAGLAIAYSLGKVPDHEFSRKRQDCLKELAELRAGPTSQAILKGLAAMREQMGKQARAQTRKKVRS